MLVIGDNIKAMILQDLYNKGTYGIQSLGKDSLDLTGISILKMEEVSLKTYKPYDYIVTGVFSKQDPKDYTKLIHKTFAINL